MTPDPSRSPSDDLAADPLADARALVAQAPGPDAAASARAEAALSRFSDLGPLRSHALRLAAWPGPATPTDPPLRRVRRPLIAVYCAAYSTDPHAPERARARLESLAAGGGALSGLARALGAGVEVFDLAVDRPSPDPARFAGDLLGARALAATLAFGLEAVAKEPDLLVVTAEAEGSDAAAAALRRALDADPEADGLLLLRRHGGREFAAVAGAVLAARTQRTPVILDGPAAEAAALCLARLRPDILDHCWTAAELAPAYAGAEPGVAGAAALSLVRLAGELEAG